MRDKRQHVRFKVHDRQVICGLMFATKVEINDISPGGISFKADRRLEIGRKYHLKLESRNKILRLVGVVVWSKLDQISKTSDDEMTLTYEAGVRFNDAADGAMICEFMDFQLQVRLRQPEIELQGHISICPYVCRQSNTL
jgi:hypothetical protein